MLTLPPVPLCLCPLIGATIKLQDQAENVPTAILGEANYREFVKSYKPDGLIVGGASNAEGMVGRGTAPIMAYHAGLVAIWRLQAAATPS